MTVCVLMDEALLSLRFVRRAWVECEACFAIEGAHLLACSSVLGFLSFFLSLGKEGGKEGEPCRLTLLH